MDVFKCLLQFGKYQENMNICGTAQFSVQLSTRKTHLFGQFVQV